MTTKISTLSRSFGTVRLHVNVYLKQTYACHCSDGYILKIGCVWSHFHNQNRQALRAIVYWTDILWKSLCIFYWRRRKCIFMHSCTYFPLMDGWLKISLKEEFRATKLLLCLVGRVSFRKTLRHYTFKSYGLPKWSQLPQSNITWRLI